MIHMQSAACGAASQPVTRALGAARFASLLSLILVAMSSVGCATKYTDYDAFLRNPKPIVGGRPYVIEPPDTIRVVAPEVPEIHNSSLSIRPDGYVTLALLGDMFAAGKTPTQFAAEIQDKALVYYEDVNIQVEVTGFNSKVYYMAGETAQGPKQYNGNVSVLDAVLTAGVPRSAWPEKLVLLRPNEEGRLIRRMSIDFDHMVRTGDLQYNVVIEEGDILYMPINPLAAVGVFIQNLLQPVSPVIQATETPRRVSGVAGGL